MSAFFSLNNNAVRGWLNTDTSVVGLAVGVAVCFFAVLFMIFLCNKSKEEAQKTIEEHRSQRKRRSTSASPVRTYYSSSKSYASSDEGGHQRRSGAPTPKKKERHSRRSQAVPPPPTTRRQGAQGAAMSPRGRDPGRRRQNRTQPASANTSTSANEFDEMKRKNSFLKSASRSTPTTPLGTVNESQYASVKDLVRNKGSAASSRGGTSSSQTMIIESYSSMTNSSRTDFSGYSKIDELLAAVDRVRAVDQYELDSRGASPLAVQRKDSLYESTSDALN